MRQQAKDKYNKKIQQSIELHRGQIEYKQIDIEVETELLKTAEPSQKERIKARISRFKENIKTLEARIKALEKSLKK